LYRYTEGYDAEFEVTLTGPGSPIVASVGKYVLINRSTYQVKPFYLSSETGLPIE
jgi:hypothetical protein